MPKSILFVTLSLVLISCSEADTGAINANESDRYGRQQDHLLGREYALIAWQGAQCQRHWLDSPVRLQEHDPYATPEQLEAANEIRQRAHELANHQARINAAFAFWRGQRLRQAFIECEALDTACREPYFRADADYWPEIERVLYADMRGVGYDPARDENCIAIAGFIRSIAETNFVRDNQPE